MTPISPSALLGWPRTARWARVTGRQGESCHFRVNQRCLYMSVSVCICFWVWGFLSQNDCDARFLGNAARLHIYAHHREMNMQMYQNLKKKKERKKTLDFSQSLMWALERLGKLWWKNHGGTLDCNFSTVPQKEAAENLVYWKRSLLFNFLFFSPHIAWWMSIIGISFKGCVRGVGCWVNG